MADSTAMATTTAISVIMSPFCSPLEIGLTGVAAMVVDLSVDDAMEVLGFDVEAVAAKTL
jgi:hypothetical protein